jgi:Sulfotransferase family
MTTIGQKATTEMVLSNIEAPSLASPIFILGIYPRSGTNYLHDLIRMHPHCDPECSLLQEDHLLANSHLLLKYIDGVSSRWWKERWGQEELEAERDLLCAEVGNALCSFLQLQLQRRKQAAGKNGAGAVARRIVTKTPSVENLELFFKFFPSAPLVILVRDGRSVVESSVKTFNQPYGYAARHWARGAERIQNFLQSNPATSFMVVRYEDLYSNVESELRRIFEFLHLDPDQYDYHAAINLPVRGSSSLSGGPSTKRFPWVRAGIHWDAVQKPADFDPVNRWSSWNRPKHERFNRIAAKHLTSFGYEPVTSEKNRSLWSAWNLVQDVLFLDQVTWFMRRVIRRVRSSRSIAELFAF